MPVVIRKADFPDARPLAAVLARAFLDDPLMRFILPDDGLRRRRLPRLFRISLGLQYLPAGEVYTTADTAGASLWSPPGRWRAPPSVVIRTLPRLALVLGTKLATSVRAISVVERAHPTEPHWYLAVVGTEPSRQGRGIGSALLAPVLQRCDHDAMPAYLESSKEANLAFYARHGFEVTKAIDLDRGGPRDLAHVAGAPAITAALLEEPVNSFIEDTTAALGGLARSVSRPLSPSLASDVAREAFNVVAAFVDADGVHTDAELSALIDCFGGRLEGELPSKPEALRRSGLLDSRLGWIARPTPMFELLVDADRKAGSELAWQYYDDAMRVAHAACALDTLTGQDELDALERFRTTLLTAMEKGGLRNPWTGRTPLAGRLPAGAVAPPATSTEVTAKPPLSPPRPIEELLSELNAMIGLDEVKAQVRTVTNLLRVAQMRRDRRLPVPDTSQHLVFTGNPGTGKTTVARLLAEIYRTLGVLDKGQLIETERSGLVAGFVGQTAIKTTEVFEAAVGGMLLIDEAYALLAGQQGDFGREAVDTLVKLMEDHRDEVAVVVAGYPDEMADFLDANPGLRSRFPRTITFPDYTTDELVAIFEGLGRESSYQLTAEARDRLHRCLDAEPRGKGFGNGRLARNLFEAAVGRQANRIVGLTNPTDADLCQLTADDLG